MKCWPKAGRVEKKLFKAISIIFQNHPHLLEFLFDPVVSKIRAKPRELLFQSGDFSSGEDLLVRVALDLWSGCGNAQVWELIEILDEGDFNNILKALGEIRPKNAEGWDGPVMRQLKWASLSPQEDEVF